MIERRATSATATTALLLLLSTIISSTAARRISRGRRPSGPSSAAALVAAFGPPRYPTAAAKGASRRTRVSGRDARSYLRLTVASFPSRSDREINSRFQWLQPPPPTPFRSTAAMSSSAAEQSSSPPSSEASTLSIAENLASVRGRIKDAAADCGRDAADVRLIAVSKTKPVEMLIEAYEAGQRHFGENYAQELTQKAEELGHLSDVSWHFVGPLQSNKAAPLVRNVGRNLRCVESVASLKLANKLNRAVRESMADSDGDGEVYRLSIYLQVNTSGEDSKSGVEPDDAPSLASEIAKACPHLSLDGLMTIGAPGDLGCFDALVACRERVAEALGVDPAGLELSMGMSGDFEEAIRRGATNVRVGSTIFGARDYADKK